ncbi:MAG: hypothetical protein ACKO0M_09000 [Cyanobium sp.]
MRVAPLLIGVALVLETSATLAQPNLRSTFPGRRVGGGTRGECTARVLAHLVPASSVYAPAAGGLIGLLEGPAANPRPVAISFRQMNASGTSDAARSLLASRDLPASGAGVTLFSQTLKGATVWESRYRCDEAPGDPNDPLAMVSTEAPPAVSLLLMDATPADTALQARLKDLRSFCGSTIPRDQLATAFDLADVVSGPDWPAQLPVRCPR